jgi:hypothetical protein
MIRPSAPSGMSRQASGGPITLKAVIMTTLVGREAVYIFTRSVVENPSSSSLPPFLYTDKFLELFGQNVDKFLGRVRSLTPLEIGMKE